MWKLYLVGASSRRWPSPVSVECQQRSLLHRIKRPRLKSKICFNCTERMHSSALRCCNAMQCNISNATYAIQCITIFVLHIMQCNACNTMQYRAKVQRWLDTFRCRAFVAIAPLNLIDSNNYSWDKRTKIVLKTSKVKTTLDQVVLSGTAQCRERSSNNWSRQR